MDSVARNRLRQREIAYLTNQLTLLLQRLHCERLRAKVQRCLLPLLLLIATRLAHQPHRRADASEREPRYAPRRSVPGEAET